MTSMYEIISRKRDGMELKREEISAVISGYVQGDIPDYQVAAWLMAIYIRGLSERELADLTEIMLDSGDSIPLDTVPGKKIDKHSTGGVGDKISFIIAPLLAACGLRVPMLSGRGLGHTGGTLDKLEAIPGMNVFLSPDQFRRVLNETGMVICGQTENIVPADKKLYALRDTTATVSCIPLIASSIMSKKLALGSDGIVLDIKTGSGAFMKDEKDALRLCRTMVAIGEKTGRKTIGLITNMNQPLGRSVGNSLEMIESFDALKGKGPRDIMEVSFALGYCMLRAAGIEKSFIQAVQMFEEAIGSGRALNVLRDFILAQGGDGRVCDDYDRLPSCKHRLEFPAPTSGIISSIDSFGIGMAAIDTGAGRRKKDDNIDYGAGFIFHANVGDRVEKGQILVTIHNDRTSQNSAILERLRREIVIGPDPVPEPTMVHCMVDSNGTHSWPL